MGVFVGHATNASSVGPGETYTATDAESAQALLRARIPDLILMDIALPGMDGLALTRIIETHRHAPISRADRQRAVGRGA